MPLGVTSENDQMPAPDYCAISELTYYNVFKEFILSLALPNKNFYIFSKNPSSIPPILIGRFYTASVPSTLFWWEETALREINHHEGNWFVKTHF